MYGAYTKAIFKNLSLGVYMTALIYTIFKI
jgi:hypothetical protein